MQTGFDGSLFLNYVINNSKSFQSLRKVLYVDFKNLVVIESPALINNA